MEKRLSDAEIEALLAGRKPAGREDLEELVELIQTVKATSHETPGPEVEKRHLAAIMEATRLEPTAPTAGRTKVLAGVFRPAWAKVAAITGAALIATSGLAAANVLPAAAQDAISSFADNFGVDVPNSEDKAARKAAKAEEKAAKAEEKAERKAAKAGEDDVDPNGATRPTGPTGSRGKSVADDVHAVLDDDSLEGRDKGDAVSDAASQNRQNETHSHSKKGPKGPTGPTGPSGPPGP